MNLYDFADTSDLPENIAAALKTSKVANPKVKIYSDIVAIATQAGQPPLSVVQVLAIAHRLGEAISSKLVVRTALNVAVTQGIIVKPTRQTYAGPAGDTVGNPPPATADPKASKVSKDAAEPVDVVDTTTPADALEDFDPLA